MNRRVVLKQLSALAMLAGGGQVALAQSDRPAFRTLDKPVATDAGDKIEVLSFFHYGCPYCRQFDPVIAPWAEKQPEDVVFRSVPVTWGNPALVNLARLHYALATLPDYLKYKTAAFAAVQDSKLRFESEQVVRDWAAKQDGMDVEALIKAYNSFGVKTALDRGDQLAMHYAVEGVPMVAVGGQFTTSPSMTGGYEQTLKVVDDLIAKVRKPAG